MSGVQVILIAIATVSGIAFLYPYLLYPLSLKAMAERPIKGTRSDTLPSATLFFSAFNEEASLPAKIANVRAIIQKWPNVDCFAYSDCSNDNTLSLLNAASDVITVSTGTSRVGKATGMRLMVEKTQADVCIFTDANVLVEPESVGRLLEYFHNDEIGGVAGTLKYINDNESTTAQVGGMYWRLEETLKRAESRCGSIMGADGSIFATRRSLYPSVPAHLLDDLTVSMAVVTAGKRLLHASDVIAYERNVVDSADEFRRKRRIACRAYNTHVYIYPGLRRFLSIGDKYKYISHKILRWFGLIPLTCCVVSIFILLIVSDMKIVAVLLAIGVLASLALGRLKVAGFRIILELLRSIYATFLGITDAWRGRTYQTWTPSKSR